MSGIITLLIAAAITWYVACGLMPWEYIGWDATSPRSMTRRA